MDGGARHGRASHNSVMKIAIASSGLGHVSRGIEAWAHDLAYALRERGEDVILCKGSGPAESDFERTIPCIRRTGSWLNRLPRRGLWRIGLGSPYEVEATTFALNLLRVLRREHIDILHVQDPLIARSVQRARARRIVPTRAILGHGTNESLDFLNKITFVQHLAPYHQEQATRSGANKPTWTAIPNFIDTDTFHPGRNDAMRDELSIPRDAVVVLSVAAIKREHKRIDHLIREFAAISESSPDLPAYLLVAGGAESDTEELVQLGRRRIGDKFQALVRFPRQRIADLYRASDIFVLCSLREMMPIALLEATASGLPCIINQHPSVEWIVGNGGRSINMVAPGALAGTLLQFIEHRDQRVNLGGLARRHCLEHFSKDRVVTQILDYYRFVLDVGASAGVTMSAASGSPHASRCEPALSLRE